MAVAILPFRGEDLEDLYAIALQTGDGGEDASSLHGDPRLIGHIYAAPYALLEPSLALVARDGEGVVGYAVGVGDTRSWEERLERDWWPALRARYPEPSGAAAPRRTAADRDRIRAIHEPPRTPPSVSAAYPAHLHMNLLPRAQGRGAGLQLLDAWLDRAGEHAPGGVHVGVAPRNARGLRFWSKGGFRPLDVPGEGEAVWMGQELRGSRRGPFRRSRSPFVDNPRRTF